MRRNPREQPTHQGRPLPRPDDQLVDQGLAFDVQTLLGRRQLLRTLGLGAVAVGLAACGSGSVTTATTSVGSTAAGPGSAGSATSAAGSSAAGSSAAGSTGGSAAAAALTEIPDETAGPYPGDGSNGPDALEQSGIVRSDIRSSFGGSTGTADGVPMTLELSIKDVVNGGAPYEGVAVYVWHCDRNGNYSMYSPGVTDQNYLRGVQIADTAGVVRYISIFPACYSGRWPHIHFEVYPDQASITDSTKAIATSQVALPEDVCDIVYARPGYEQSMSNLSRVTLTGDNVFGDDGAVHQLGSVTGDATSGYHVALTVPVDTGTTPSGGSAPGRGGGPGGGPGG